MAKLCLVGQKHLLAPPWSSSWLPPSPASLCVPLTPAAHLSELLCVSTDVEHRLTFSSPCVTGMRCHADWCCWAPKLGSTLPSLQGEGWPCLARCLGLASAFSTDRWSVGLPAQQQVPGGDGHVPLGAARAEPSSSGQTSGNHQFLPPNNERPESQADQDSFSEF